jgi:hypothetical protein
MADRLTYMEGDPTFQEVAQLVRDMGNGMWRSENAVGASLMRAEAANPENTYQGALIREAGVYLRATAALAARPAGQKWVGTLELALTFQPNSFPVVREQLRTIVIPGHPDVEATYLDAKAPDRMTLQFAFEAASADEADEIARLYAGRVVSQFSRYGAELVPVSAE